MGSEDADSPTTEETADAGPGAAGGGGGDAGTATPTEQYIAWFLERYANADEDELHDLVTRDTDGDGVTDYDEIQSNTDPLDEGNFIQVDPPNIIIYDDPPEKKKEPGSPDAGPDGSAALARALLPAYRAAAARKPNQGSSTPGPRPPSDTMTSSGSSVRQLKVSGTDDAPARGVGSPTALRFLERMQFNPGARPPRGSGGSES